MKVLVIGDACEDVYVYGSSTRLAPEAPVPVFVEKYKKTVGGMALNVYNNLKSLGIGCEVLHNAKEIQKTRYVDHQTNHLFIRIDSDEEEIDRIESKYLEKDFLLQYDAIVISDYNKGFLSEEDIEKICFYHPLTFMDTKKKLGRWSEDCTWIKINFPEYENTRGEIANRMYIYEESLIVTIGSKGCRYKDKVYPVSKVEIKDLSGAGDTFLSGFVTKFLQTKDVDEALKFANECATIVVQQKGVNVINGI
jgi:bifunctional ADP-heptose synthase (sugar kinase/adenylyltransferase)